MKAKDFEAKFERDVHHQSVDRRMPREAGVVIVRLDRVFRAVGYSNGLIVGTILS